MHADRSTLTIAGTLVVAMIAGLVTPAIHPVINRPPSMLNAWPVTPTAASEARYKRHGGDLIGHQASSQGRQRSFLLLEAHAPAFGVVSNADVVHARFHGPRADGVHGDVLVAMHTPAPSPRPQ
jgi:hypothetical protein